MIEISTRSHPKPPVAERRPLTLTQLGRSRTDEFAWLKDENWQAVMRDPKALRGDIRSHLEAENAYTEAMLAETKALQDAIFAEMRGRIKEDDSSVPAKDGPYAYGTRFETGSQHPIHIRTPRDGGPEEILLNEEQESKAHAFYDVGGAGHSPGHDLYAWAVDIQGSEYYTIFIKDLKTGEILPHPVESSTGDFTFSPCGAYLFWTFRDENGRPSQIYRRPVRGSEDTLVYTEEDPGFFIGVGTTDADRFIEITIGNQETSESRLIPASDPTAAPFVAEPRQVGTLYDLTDLGGRFLVRTNIDGAEDFALYFADKDHPARQTWTPFRPHQAGTMITGVIGFSGHIARTEVVNANTRIVITDRSDLSEHTISFDEDAYVLGMIGGFEYDTTSLRIVYASPTTPSQVYDYDMQSRDKVLRKEQVIPSGHTPSDYVAKRLYATAPDGEEVPITVLMRKDTPLDGSAPLLLYGYGSYGASMEPGFSIRNLSLVNRGWIWATAHIRGGSEKGRGWFLNGRKFKKTNTFTDFIACAEHLVAKGFSTSGRMVAYGGSAGGMLMGAIANTRPDLWAGVIGAVPFVDVLNTMSDVSLPLTPPEWPEWGNPIEDEAAYDYIQSYSPYDQIAAKPYPPVLATGGLSDPRVTYWEPAKWIAKLRQYSTSDAPMLLKINMEAGHAGSSGRFDFLKEIAFDYAFALWAINKGWTQSV